MPSAAVDQTDVIVVMIVGVWLAAQLPLGIVVGRYLGRKHQTTASTARQPAARIAVGVSADSVWMTASSPGRARITRTMV